jgi:hypothetical protein
MRPTLQPRLQGSSKHGDHRRFHSMIMQVCEFDPVGLHFYWWGPFHRCPEEFDLSDERAVDSMGLKPPKKPRLKPS